MDKPRELTPAQIAYRDKEHALDLLVRIRRAQAAFDDKPADMDSEVDFRFEAIKGMLNIAHADAFNMAQLWLQEYRELISRAKSGSPVDIDEEILRGPDVPKNDIAASKA